MSRTKIEWCGYSWNPVTGCTPVSVGCKNCYAERMARWLAGRYGYPKAPNHFKVTLHPERLEQPLHMKNPHMIFVCSMGDLFHEDVAAWFIIQMFDVMAVCPQQIFQILTKRPERIRSILYGEEGHWYLGGGDYYSNIWIGFTAENQETLDKRWPVFCDALGTEYFTTFVSLEPLLGPITLCKPVLTSGLHPAKVTWCKPLDWVIVGGETGPGWRLGEFKSSDDWFDGARDIRDQCKKAKVPFFFKKPPGGGKLGPDGFTLNTPEDLKIRQWPRQVPKKPKELPE